MRGPTSGTEGGGAVTGAAGRRTPSRTVTGWGMGGPLPLRPLEIVGRAGRRRGPLLEFGQELLLGQDAVLGNRPTPPDPRRLEGGELLGVEVDAVLPVCHRLPDLLGV